MPAAGGGGDEAGEDVGARAAEAADAEDEDGREHNDGRDVLGN